MNADKNKSYVILDTNIIQYFSNKDLAKSISDTLTEVVESGYDIAISNYTFFESIDGANRDTEVRRVEVIGKFARFSVTKSILIAAAHLGCLYNLESINYVDIGDKIIGATALLRNSLIFTANGRDYPRPFFSEITQKEIISKNKKGVGSLLTFYFLKPNIEYIETKFKERIKVKTFEELKHDNLKIEMNIPNKNTTRFNLLN
jgi:predicted nucleic acid-binding protein